MVNASAAANFFCLCSRAAVLRTLTDLLTSWPKDIAPKDMGYPLAIDDPWYDRPANKDAKAFRDKNSYKEPPAADILEAAQAKRKDDVVPGAKRPASSSPPPSRRNVDEVLEIVDGRLMARDQVLDTTRPLSPEELREDVEVVAVRIGCARENAAKLRPKMLCKTRSWCLDMLRLPYPPRTALCLLLLRVLFPEAGRRWSGLLCLRKCQALLRYQARYNGLEVDDDEAT